MDVTDLELFERSLRQATGNLTGAALDAALGALGWRDALAVDPRAAVSTLFALQGGANATSSALVSVVMQALGLEGNLVLPALGGWAPPGERRGDQLTVRGVGTAAIAQAGRALVVARAGGKDLVFDVPIVELNLRPVHGLDPWFGLVEVSGGVAGQPSVAVVAWEAAVALGHLAVGHELVGAARAMLDLARAHALERVQFGRPIATFQAIRHRLAETLVAIESAEALLTAAWEDPSAGAAAMAKAVAGRSARTATRHCQQVLAGIGFTTEHTFHRYARRCLVLDQLLGSARALTSELGTELLRTRQLPSVLPL